MEMVGALEGVLGRRMVLDLGGLDWGCSAMGSEMGSDGVIGSEGVCLTVFKRKSISGLTRSNQGIPKIIE